MRGSQRCECRGEFQPKKSTLGSSKLRLRSPLRRLEYPHPKMQHRNSEELEAALDDIRCAPNENGTVELIVRRPAENEREVIEEGELSVQEGLVGDSWRLRPSSSSAVGKAHPDMQLNLMNARSAAVIAVERERWPLAGDQFYVDFDLSADNLPPGTRLQIGTATIAITDQPHLGCAKFRARFGDAALRFVNSTVGKELNLRGINARVVRPGVVRRGDPIVRI